MKEEEEERRERSTLEEYQTKKTKIIILVYENKTNKNMHGEDRCSHVGCKKFPKKYNSTAYLKKQSRNHNDELWCNQLRITVASGLQLCRIGIVLDTYRIAIVCRDSIVVDVLVDVLVKELD